VAGAAAEVAGTGAEGMVEGAAAGEALGGAPGGAPGEAPGATGEAPGATGEAPGATGGLEVMGSGMVKWAALGGAGPVVGLGLTCTQEEGLGAAKLGGAGPVAVGSAAKL